MFPVHQMMRQLIVYSQTRINSLRIMNYLELTVISIDMETYNMDNFTEDQMKHIA